MNRYNPFNQIHKGLRSLLFETAQLLQQTDFTNREEAGVAVERLADVIELFEIHAHSEDNFVLPAIEEYEPSVVSLFAEEHDRDHELGQRLKELIFVLTHSITEETKIETGKTINRAFIEFTVFNLEHMAKEEKVLNKFLWRYYSDEQLHGFTKKIVAQLAPELIAKFNKWMMRGLSDSEIVGWLQQVKSSAPDFVFDGLVTTAERELQVERWVKVNSRVRL